MKVVKMINVAGIRVFEGLIVLLQYASGCAAVLISISTTVFVLGHIFPNTYIPMGAGIALDLAKVSSIYMGNFNRNQNMTTKYFGIVWRLMLVAIAALFTCISITGMMFNKNIGTMASAEKQMAKEQYENMLAIEKEDYNSRYSVLEEEKREELVTGVGPRYKRLCEEQLALTESYQLRNTELTQEYNMKLQDISIDTFEGNRNKNVILFENFKDSINMAFSIKTTYTYWILVLVVMVALILELTTYVIFDNLATSIQPYILKLQNQRSLALESYFQIRKNEIEFETEVSNIATDSNLQKVENSAEAEVLAEKYSDGLLKAELEINEEIENIKSNTDKHLLASLKDVISDLRVRNRKVSA